MKSTRSTISKSGVCAALGLASLLWLPAVSAVARDGGVRSGEQSTLQAQYQQELAACRNGQTKQTVAACLDEARSAFAQAKRGALDDHGASYTANANLRCAALSGAEQVACTARMRGEGSTSGTAEDGGIYRELTTVTPGAEPMPDAMPMQKNMRNNMGMPKPVPVMPMKPMKPVGNVAPE